MINYQELPLLPTKQRRRRFDAAKKALGEKGLTKLLAFALYVLGGNRRRIAELAGLPIPTLQSLTERVLRDGLPGFEDRRQKATNFLPQAETQPEPVALRIEKESLVIQVDKKKQVVIPRSNPVQCRTVLFTFLNSGLLKVSEVAQGLGLSTERVRQLRKKLVEEDAKALIDQRQGQRQDYLVTPEVKAALIQEYVVKLLTDGRTSSERLRESLSKRCDIWIAARTIRLHLDKLGLRQIRDSLPRLIEEVKKTAGR
jgi:transposase